MGLGNFVKNVSKSINRAGEVNGSEFPLGTYINFLSNEGEKYILFTYPNNTEEKITHDLIKCATILAMGVINIKTAASAKGLFANNKAGVMQGNVATEYGIKYLCVLKDGRQAVLTVSLDSQYMVERVLF